MSVGLYDKAVVEKIRRWVVDPKLTILYPDESKRFFTLIADENKDKISLPLIAVSRDRDIKVNLTNKRRGEYQGRVFNSNGSNSDHLNKIPITLNYTFDIYTRYRKEADEYVRNFIYNIIDYPTLEIEIPYLNSQLKQVSYMELLPDILDNSDIPERLISGQFTRMTINITLKDAGLFSYKVEDIPKVTSIDIRGRLAEPGGHAINDDCEDFTGELNIKETK